MKMFLSFLFLLPSLVFATSWQDNVSLLNQKEFRFYELKSNGSNYASVKAPASLAGNYTLTLPVDDGTSGQVLSTDGSGVLS